MGHVFRGVAQLHPFTHVLFACKPKAMEQNIEEGKIVLLCRDKVFKPVKFTKGKKVVFERMSFIPDVAIGMPFGSQFEVKGHQLVVSQRVDPTQFVEEVSDAKDNRSIKDDGSSQCLTHKEIHDMKEEGKSGQDILESVIHGSLSFKEKTSYSQEKYVKKKEKKHLSVIKIVKPSTRLLCQMYYSKSPSKICHLRIDTLARILTLGNVHSGVNALVVETCQGLLMGAVLERLGGVGNVVQMFFGDKPVRIALDNFGHVSDEMKSIVMTYPVQRLSKLREMENSVPSVDQGNVIKEETSMPDHMTSMPDHTTSMPDHMTSMPDHMMSTCDQEMTGEEQRGEGLPPLEKRFKESSPEERGGLEEEGNRHNDEMDHIGGDDASRRYQYLIDREKEKEERRKQREESYQKTASFLLSNPMDCLLIATRFHPEPILTALLPYVAPSRPVVVYSQFQEPLVKCYQMLRERGGMFNMQISETWLRQYQVLPNRTHPCVNMDAQSGYVLVGTTIVPSN